MPGITSELQRTRILSEVEREFKRVHCAPGSFREVVPCHDYGWIDENRLVGDATSLGFSERGRGFDETAEGSDNAPRGSGAGRRFENLLLPPIVT